MDQAIDRNVMLTILEKLLNSMKLLDKQKSDTAVSRWVGDLNIKVGNVQDPVTTLSGGNQQRVVLAKWIATEPKIFLLDSPTVGVDIAAKSGIYEIVKQLAAEGMGVVMISDEVPEVLYNCHRILLMRKGAIVGEFFPDHITESELNRKINEN
jgi:simple sugar transport system ATP-binding protein